MEMQRALRYLTSHKFDGEILSSVFYMVFLFCLALAIGYVAGGEFFLKVILGNE